MNVLDTALPGVRIIEPRVFTDDRGAFFEAWQAERYARAVRAAGFLQDSVSVSRRGVIRGLHFQHPHPQAKLVGVLQGAAFDVAVDVRRGSPTFARWVAVELSAGNRRQLWVPGGFAHGFQALTDDVVFHYKTTDVHHPECERTVHYADADLGIAWPLPSPTVSPRDERGPRLRELGHDALPPFP